MKKFLSLVLALVMTMSLVTVGAGARDFKDFTDDSEITYAEAVDVISALGIVGGYADGSFNPNGNLTRGAAAKIICNMVLSTTTAEALVASSAPFSDVPTDNVFAGYIAYCAQQGIVGGYADGTFKPAAPLTGYAFMKMLLTTLGYDAAIEGYTGSNWQINVAKQAIAIELDDGIESFNGTKTVTREVACQLAFNALKSNVVEYSDKGTSITINGATITSGASKADYVKSTKNQLNAVALNDKDNDYLQFGEKVFPKLKAATTGKFDDFGRAAVEWTYDTKDVGTYGEAADEVVVIKKSNDKTLAKIADDLDLEFAAGATFTNVVTGATFDETAKPAAGTIVEFTLNDDGDVKAVVCYNYILDQIEDVDTEVSKADAKDGVSCYVDFKIGASNVKDTDIAGFNAETYVKDAYVAMVATAGGKIIASNVADVVTGTVSEIEDGTKAKKVTVDGKTYTAVEGFNTNGVLTLAVSGVSKSADDSYNVYLDPNGMIIGIDGVKDTADISEVYYVDATWVDSKVVAGDTVDTVYAQLLNLADGTISEIKVENKDNVVGSATAADDLSDSSNAAKLASIKGTMVTISDKKEANSKKDNDKFNLTAWDLDGWETPVTGTIGADLKKDTTRFTLGSTTVRVNSSTKYVLVEKSGKDLDTKVVTGGISFDKTKVSSATALIVEDEKYASYVIIHTNDADEKTEYTEDVIFIKSDDGVVGDGYFLQTVYMNDGSKKTWKIDDGESITTGFFTYGVNKDGFYEIDPADGIAAPTDGIWDDEEGVVTVKTTTAMDLVDDMLTVTSEERGKIEDINVKGVKFVDLHSTDSGYEYAISSMTKLAKLVDDGAVTSIELYMNVNEDGAVVAFLKTAA